MSKHLAHEHADDRSKTPARWIERMTERTTDAPGPAAIQPKEYAAYIRWMQDGIATPDAAAYARKAGMRTMQTWIDDSIRPEQPQHTCPECGAARYGEYGRCTTPGCTETAPELDTTPEPAPEPVIVDRLPRYVDQLQNAEVWISRHRSEHCREISRTAYAALLHAADHLNDRIARELRPEPLENADATPTR